MQLTFLWKHASIYCVFPSHGSRKNGLKYFLDTNKHFTKTIMQCAAPTTLPTAIQPQKKTGQYRRRLPVFESRNAQKCITVRVPSNRSCATMQTLHFLSASTSTKKHLLYDQPIPIFVQHHLSIVLYALTYFPWNAFAAYSNEEIRSKDIA